MFEKEKMLAGKLYNANYDEELIKERMNVKDKCFEYNNIKPSNIEDRTKLMKEILGKYKDNFFIEQPFMCDYGYNIEIGENFYSNHNLIILDANKVKFGNNVFIAPNCGFYTAGHPLDYEIRDKLLQKFEKSYKRRNKGLEYAKPITVGNNVWIGGNVIVLPGVTIGDNVIIGAGSVVTKDIPDNKIAYGNPCRIIRDND